MATANSLTFCIEGTINVRGINNTDQKDLLASNYESLNLTLGAGREKVECKFSTQNLSEFSSSKRIFQDYTVNGYFFLFNSFFLKVEATLEPYQAASEKVKPFNTIMTPRFSLINRFSGVQLNQTVRLDLEYALSVEEGVSYFGADKIKLPNSSGTYIKIAQKATKFFIDKKEITSSKNDVFKAEKENPFDKEGFFGKPQKKIVQHPTPFINLI